MTGWHFTIQAENNRYSIPGVKYILLWPSESPDVNPTEHALHMLTKPTKLKAEMSINKQWKTSALNA